MSSALPHSHSTAPAQLTLHATGLTVGYEKTVALTIPALHCSGGVIAVVGHNGAGKSTLIKSILGLLPLTTGDLHVTYSQGAAPTTLTPERDMAFCPETGAVFSDISVESYIKLWCRIKHHDPNYYRAKGSRYLELLHISPLLHKRGRELSKGQRRRVQTAIGFLTEPKLFLFDEPFDGLDVQRTSELADLVQAHRSSTTFIISSHRMDVMERVADQVVVLRQGGTASVGALESVCTELAGVTFQLSQIRGLDQLCDSLRAALPRAVIGRIGAQLYVTHRELTEKALQSILYAAGETQATLSAAPPRLVDAMSYHLAEMQQKNPQ